ncbi:FRG domain-containing protein [Halomonas daqingensis]|uniref:FRG domain-containing protein n=1 Tax=Billgrantia desiderata TaxID=52021 RepID=UPI001F2C6521|nr:FRG domain-containing protein [Halomonas desiderata]MCE8027692.1 FRG domain-containing protein [Halomonas desiderata]
MRNFGNIKLWCHLSLDSGDRYTNKEIRESAPAKIPNFRELVKSVARIANHNPDYSLFFRGQARDYKLNSGASSFYPTILRSPGRSLTTKELEERYKRLDTCASQLLSKLEELDIDNINKLKKFPELTWSILQHYEVCETPLLDFTHSLRVAASFTLNDASDSAYIFVFAFPYPNGTVSYSTEEELLNVRLLSACPYEALRPHFQEGYLLGSFPPRVNKKQPFLYFGRRVIAKFEIPKKSFWSEDFHEIPSTALYPPDDEIAAICAEIKSKYVT